MHHEVSPEVGLAEVVRSVQYVVRSLSFVFHSVFLCHAVTCTYICRTGQECLHIFNHDNVCGVTEFYLSTKFRVIHDLQLNQNKKTKNFDNGYFQFNIFPGHITDPIINQSYLLTIFTH